MYVALHFCFSLSFAISPSFLCRYPGYPQCLMPMVSMGWFIFRHVLFPFQWKSTTDSDPSQIHHRDIHGKSCYSIGRVVPIFPSHPHRVRRQRLSCPTLLSITILMGLSRGITVHCGNSFTNERHKSIQHPHSPKIRRVKLNKTQKELQQAQWKQNEHMACMYPLLLLVVLTQLSPSAVLSFQERQDFYLSENDLS